MLTRGTPLNHTCGRVAKLALERRRVQQRCPRGFSSAALGHRPQNRTKGADPRTGTLQRRKVFLPGCSVFSLSWPACAGAFLVPGRWFSGPAPSVSCLFCSAPDVSFYWPRASLSCSQREGRRVKRRGTDPRTGTGRRPKDRLLQVSPFTQYVYIFSAIDVFSQYWVTGHFWFLFSPSPLHDRGGARWRPHHFWMLLFSHSSHLRRFHSVSRHPSFGWP